MKHLEFTANGHRFLIQEDTDGHTWNHLTQRGHSVVEEGNTFPTACEAQQDAIAYATQLQKLKDLEEAEEVELEKEMIEQQLYGSYRQQVCAYWRSTRL